MSILTARRTASALRERLLPHVRRKKQLAARTSAVGHGSLNTERDKLPRRDENRMPFLFVLHKADKRPACPLEQKAKGIPSTRYHGMNATNPAVLVSKTIACSEVCAGAARD